MNNQAKDAGEKLDLCVFYNLKTGCSQKYDCLSLHFCHIWLFAECFLGSLCDRSHNLEDEKIKLRKHGFHPKNRSELQKILEKSDAVRAILKLLERSSSNPQMMSSSSNRNPEICLAYNLPKGCTSDLVCSYLHICKPFTLMSCKREDNCPYEHSLSDIDKMKIRRHRCLIDSKERRVLRDLTQAVENDANVGHSYQQKNPTAKNLNEAFQKDASVEQSYQQKKPTLNDSTQAFQNDASVGQSYQKNSASHDSTQAFQNDASVGQSQQKNSASHDSTQAFQKEASVGQSYQKNSASHDSTQAFQNDASVGQSHQKNSASHDSTQAFQNDASVRQSYQQNSTSHDSTEAFQNDASVGQSCQQKNSTSHDSTEAFQNDASVGQSYQQNSTSHDSTQTFHNHPNLGGSYQQKNLASNDLTPALQNDASAGQSYQKNSTSHDSTQAFQNGARVGHDLPEVCRFYNKHFGCKNKNNCPYVHLCKDWATSSCENGSTCLLRHSLWAKDVDILEFRGLTGTAEELADAYRIRATIKNQVTSQKSVKFEAPSVTTSCSERQTISEKTAAVPESIDDICIYYLRNTCCFGDKCLRIHPVGKSSFCWRYKMKNDEKWLYFRPKSNKILEEFYLDPSAKTVEVESIWMQFQFKLNVDFDTMTAVDDNFVQISRLAVEKDWTWYLETEPESNKWAKFGAQYNKIYVTSISSADIEEKYQQLTTISERVISFFIYCAEENCSKSWNCMLNVGQNGNGVAQGIAWNLTDGSMINVCRRPRDNVQEMEKAIDQGLFGSKLTEKWRTGGFQKLKLKPNRYINFNDSIDAYFRYAESHFLRLAQLCGLRATVDYVDMFINPELESKFESRRKHLGLSRGKEFTREILVLHGTPLEDPEPIMKHNFSLEKVKRYRYGFGIYFSEHADLSIHFTGGHKGSLIMSRVLCGVQKDAKQCPVMTSQIRQICNDHDAHTVDQEAGRYARITIIQNVDQILPVFVVHWKYT